MDWELGGKNIIRDGGVVARHMTQDGQNNTLLVLLLLLHHL